MLKDEVSVLTDENSKLKDMVRDAEARTTSPALAPAAPPPPPPPSPHRKDCDSPAAVAARSAKDDNLSKLTREFLDELSSLELRERSAAAAAAASASAGGGGGGGGGGVAATAKSVVVAPAPTLPLLPMKKSPTVNVQADV